MRLAHCPGSLLKGPPPDTPLNTHILSACLPTHQPLAANDDLGLAFVGVAWEYKTLEGEAKDRCVAWGLSVLMLVARVWWIRSSISQNKQCILLSSWAQPVEPQVGAGAVCSTER